MGDQSLTDTPAHSRKEQDFGNPHWRAMGYNYISTGHEGTFNDYLHIPDRSDNAMMLYPYGERRFPFGASHTSVAFGDFSKLDAKTRVLWGEVPVPVLAFNHRMRAVPILNHPAQDWRFNWRFKLYNWGHNDRWYHFFGGYNHQGPAFGHGDHLWPIFSFTEGPRHLDGLVATHWKEQNKNYLYGLRRGPLFGLASTDAKSFNQGGNRRNHSGSYIWSRSFDINDLEQYAIAGNSTMSIGVANRLLVTLEDEQGNYYMPGNTIKNIKRDILHVTAWSPYGLNAIQLMNSKGIYKEFPVQGHFVEKLIALEDLPPLGMLIVGLQSKGNNGAAIANPFFLGLR